MKKYRVIAKVSGYIEYEVEADNINEAKEKMVDTEFPTDSFDPDDMGMYLEIENVEDSSDYWEGGDDELEDFNEED